MHVLSTFFYIFIFCFHCFQVNCASDNCIIEQLPTVKDAECTIELVSSKGNEFCKYLKLNLEKDFEIFFKRWKNESSLKLDSELELVEPFQVSNLDEKTHILKYQRENTSTVIFYDSLNQYLVKEVPYTIEIKGTIVFSPDNVAWKLLYKFH